MIHSKQQEGGESHQKLAKAQSDISSQQINCSSQAQTQDHSNKQSKPLLQVQNAVVTTESGANNSKSKMKKPQRAQSTNEYAKSSAFSANDPNSEIPHNRELNDSAFPPRGGGNCKDKDSLQEEFDRILDKNNEKMNFLNASIGVVQKRAQSSTSNYHMELTQQVNRPSNAKKKKKRRDDIQRQMNVTEVHNIDHRNQQQIPQSGKNDYEIMDFGKLSVQKLGNNEHDQSADTRSINSSINVSQNKKKKRESSAFSQFSKSIRSSISNIFSKKSQIQIAPVQNDIVNQNNSQQFSNAGSSRPASRNKSDNSKKPPKSSEKKQKDQKHSKRYDMDVDQQEFDVCAPYTDPKYQFQNLQLNVSSSKNIAPVIGPIGGASNQFIDREEIKRRLRETKAEKKSRQHIVGGMRARNPNPVDKETNNEMFKLMIESGCYNTANQNSMTIESQMKKNFNKLSNRMQYFSPENEVVHEDTKSNKIDSSEKKTIRIRNVLPQYSNDKETDNNLSTSQVRINTQQSAFFLENLASKQQLITDEKQPKKLKLQKIKFNSKDKKEQIGVSPNYNDQSQNESMGLKKELATQSIKSDFTTFLNQEVKEINGLKIQRDQNGKLKLKKGNNRKMGSKEISVISSRNQSKTSDQFKKFCEQQIIQENNPKEGNTLQMMNQKKLISTLDHSRKKPTLKHTQSAQENTIQVNKGPERQVVQNNNFTRASMPHAVGHMKPELRQTPSMVLHSQAGNLVYLCANHQLISGHSKELGLFYCSQDRQYLCESCIVEHRHHSGLDSVKNHLVAIFDEWCALLSHAQNVTQSLINTNVTKSREILLHLKRNCIEPPEIDVFKLRIIFENLQKRLQKKINEIRDICKHNDLEKALNMHQDLAVFIYQIRELEDKSSVTGMFSTYLRSNQNDDDLKLYQGLSNQRQYFLLRKQFDDRMKKLANLSLIQRVRIQKYENYIENSIMKKEQQQQMQKQDFESQFHNIFQQKMEQIRCQKLLQEQIQIRNQLNGFPEEKHIECVKSRESIQVSASVQDINEMIENLNNNYSNHLVQQDKYRAQKQSSIDNQLENFKNNNMIGGNVGSAISTVTVTFDNRPKMKLNKTEKLNVKRVSQPVFDVKKEVINENNENNDNNNKLRDKNPTLSLITQNHMKNTSLVSQISDFNQSIKRNSNYESIMKSTRQKIIQSHMMQSAQKQKPYLMRLSTIFGDKNKDKTPMGIKGDPSQIELGRALRKQTMQNFNKPPRCGGLSPPDNSKHSAGFPMESQISSFQGTLINMGFSDFPTEKGKIVSDGSLHQQPDGLKKYRTNITSPQKTTVDDQQFVVADSESQSTVKLAMQKVSLEHMVNNSSTLISPTKISERYIVPQTDMVQTIRLEKTDVRNEELADKLTETPLFSQQLQQEISETFNEKILSDQRPSEHLIGEQDKQLSLGDYEDLCNLNESVLKRLQTAQIGKELGKNSSSTTTRPLIKNLEQQIEIKCPQITRNNRQSDIYHRFNMWPSNLNISKSSRMVDWSDKLKHMEIKDVMDIDIGNMTEEFSSEQELNNKDQSYGLRKRNSIQDDSFTQYLEKLKQEDDEYMERDELNYKLDQLGSYQSCYIDNKTPMKNRGPVPEDIISHLDYLDEGVLIMQPEDDQTKPIMIDKKSSKNRDVKITASRTIGQSSLFNQIINESTSQMVNNGSSAIHQPSPFTRLLNKEATPSVLRKTHTFQVEGTLN